MALDPHLQIGVGLVESELDRLELEEGQQQVPRPVAWDPSLVELRSSTSSAIPRAIEECWSRAKHRASCGLFLPTLRQAWVSIDSVVYIWDYGLDNPPVLSVAADSAIISVAACKPRPGVFPAEVRYLLVVASRHTVSLVGLQSQSVETSMDITVATDGNIRSASTVTSTKPENLQQVPLEGYAAPTDGAFFHCIRHTTDGRIFLICGAPHIFELAYASGSTWLRSRCRLVRHAPAPTTWRPWGRGVGRLRLLACASHDFAFTVDDLNTLRMHRVHGGADLNADCVASFELLCSLTKEDMTAQVFALTRVPLSSTRIEHVFSALGDDGSMYLDAVTSANERLHFICRVHPQAGTNHKPSNVALQLVRVAPPQYSGYGGGRLLRDEHPFVPESSRGTCLEEAREPCIYSGGVWILAARCPGVAISDVHFSMRVDDKIGVNGQAGAFEMHGKHTLDSVVLEIAAESHASAPGLSQMSDTQAQSVVPGSDMWHSRTFVLLLSNCVQTLTFVRQAQHSNRPPASVAECCRYLAQLPMTLANPDASRCMWMWNLDDARVPSFEEQRRCLVLLEHSACRPGLPPPLSLGKWFGGLLRFSALLLRPVWNTPLVSHARHSRLFATQPRLAVSETLVHQTLAQLVPAIRFVREGTPARQSVSTDMSSAVGRSRLFARDLTTETGVMAQARQLLQSVLDVLDRVQQCLSLLSIVYAHACEHNILQSSALAEPYLKMLSTAPLRQLVDAPPSMEPVVQLCTALLVEAGVGGSGDVYQDLQAQCPSVFAQVDFSRCVSAQDFAIGDSDQPTSDLLRRYVQCVSSDSQEDQWSLLCRGLTAMAKEDAAGAATICIEKLTQLHGGDTLAHGRARTIIEALVDGLRPHGGEAGKNRAVGALENVLLQTAPGPLNTTADEGENTTAADAFKGAGNLTFVQGLVFDALLDRPQLQDVLEALVFANIVEIDSFLRERCVTSRAAGECLWKSYLHQNRPNLAAGVLLQLAERPDHEVGLRQRLDYLQLAKQHASEAVSLGCSELEHVPDQLELRVSVAAHVQVPLLEELRLLSMDERVSDNWRSIALRHMDNLEQLSDLQDLYRVAVELSFFHIVLLILEVSDSRPGPEVVTSLWASLFFMPDQSPYSPAGMKVTPSQPPCGLFPLMTVRKFAPFFGKGEPLLSEEAANLEADVRGVLRQSSERLLVELREVTQPDSVLWDVRSFTAVFEYSSCVWLLLCDECDACSTMDSPSGEKSAKDALRCRSMSSGSLDSRRVDKHGLDKTKAWIAINILSEAPFKLGYPERMALYAEMLAHLTAWAKDMRSATQLLLAQPPQLHAEEHGLSASNEELRFHLGEVVLCLLSHWVEDLELLQSRENPFPFLEFRNAWSRTVESLLAGLSLRFNSQQGDVRARRLLPEVLRLEAASRIICSSAAHLKGHGKPRDPLRPIGVSELGATENRTDVRP